MTGDSSSSLIAAVAEEIETLIRANPRVALIVLPSVQAQWNPHTETQPSGRSFAAPGVSAAVEEAERRVKDDEIPVVVGAAPDLALEGYAGIRNTLCRPRRNVKLVALGSGLFPDMAPSSPAVLEDVGLILALPNACVFAPADAPSARAALRTSLGHDGLVYVRISGGAWPAVTGGEFEVGRAPVVADGDDLTVMAYGPLVGRALEVAGRFQPVGISVRVLDCASLKPFDEKAIVRAARETGAVLTLEDHTPLTGLGALVARVTAAECPVPVRSLGVPDVFAMPHPGEGIWDSYGLGLDSVVDEAWELLRLRGKVQ